MGTPHLTGRRGQRFITVEEFLAQLPALLDAMARDPRCFVVVAQFDDVRYVQFWVEPNGELIAEVVSNRRLSTFQALSGHDEALLRAAHWREPSSDMNPNWWTEARGPASIPELMEITQHAVRVVLGEGHSNRVKMCSWTVERDEAPSIRLRHEMRVIYRAALRSSQRDLDDT